MAKDPAMLWYFNDWTGGTVILTRHQKGCYMDLLAAQFNIGALSLEEIKTVLGSDFGSSWPALQKKFKFENDVYFNERLQQEKEKRSAYSESRRNNRKSYVNHMSPHMENVNEDENTNEIKNTYGEFKKVKLTSEEHEKLIERLGEKNTKMLVTELDGYVESLGKKGETKYKNHYATILNWARRKVTQHVERSQSKGKTFVT